MEEQIFEGQIYYRLRRSPGAAHTLLFIHGLSGSSSAWQPYEHAFANEYTTLAVDLRGHGKSFKPARAEDYGIAAQAALIARLLDALALPPVIAIGHSLGTLVALELIHTRRDIVATVFIAPNTEIHTGLRAWTSVPLVRGASAIAQWLPMAQKPGTQVDYARYKGTGDWNPRRMLADIPNTSAHVYLYSLAQAYRYSESADWRIKIPTLVIYGDDDSIIPESHIEHLGEMLPSAQYEKIAGGNHVAVINNIPQVIELLSRFVSKMDK